MNSKAANPSIVKYSDPDFNQQFENLAKSQSFFSSLYTSSSLSYYKQRPTDEGKLVQDQSFIIQQEGCPILGFIGAKVVEKDVVNLISSEIPCVSIADKAINKRSKRIATDYMEEVLGKVNGKIIFRDYLINGNLSTISKYLLEKKGEAKQHFSQIIDLHNPHNLEKASMRKSYTSIINWGLRELNPQIYNSQNITRMLMDEFRKLHIKEVGRETRSVQSWIRQLEMIQAGEAFIVLGVWKGELVSAAFFPCNFNHCYYGSPASRRDLFEKPLLHSLMWKAIHYAKEIGCRWFEVGEQVFPNSKLNPTEKEMNISHFKAGFGGDTYMFLDIHLHN